MTPRYTLVWNCYCHLSVTRISHSCVDVKHLSRKRDIVLQVLSNLLLQHCNNRWRQYMRYNGDISTFSWLVLERMVLASTPSNMESTQVKWTYSLAWDQRPLLCCSTNFFYHISKASLREVSCYCHTKIFQIQISSNCSTVKYCRVIRFFFYNCFSFSSAFFIGL